MLSLSPQGLVNDSLNCGSEITIYANSQMYTLPLDNNFNNQTLGAGWTATTGVQFNNPCGTSPSGLANDFYLWMGNQVPLPRALTTIEFDVSCGGSICFDIRYAVQGQASPCEGIDLPEEGVTLQFQTCATCPWQNIIYMNANGTLQSANPGPGGGGGIGGQTPFTVWGTYCFNIPPGGETSATKFRWIQEAYSSQGNDHWGLDNIQIIANSCGTFQYSWNNGAFNIGDVDFFTNNFTQDTTIWVSLTNGAGQGCYDTLHIPVRHPRANIIASDTLICEGEQINLNVTTGNSIIGFGNYSYSWDPSYALSSPQLMTTDATPLQTTNYKFNIYRTNFPSCTATDSQLITVINPVPPVLVNPGDLCYNLPDLYLQSDQPGGNWSGVGIVDNVTGQFSPFNAGVGSRIVTYTTPGMCPLSNSMTIEILPAPPIYTSPDTTICHGAFANLRAYGAHTYLWFPDTTLSDTSGSSIMANPLTQNKYYVVGTFQSGCYNIDSITVNVLPSLRLEGLSSAEICLNDTTKLLSFQGNGGIGYPYTYTISNPYRIIPTSDTAFYSYSDQTIKYVITLTDKCGSTPDTDSITVTVNPLPEILFTENAESYCAPATIEFINTTLGAAYSLWDFDDGGYTNVYSPTYVYINPGVFYISLKTIDGKGCANELKDYKISIYDSPTAGMYSSLNQTTILNPEVTLTSNSSPDASIFEWFISDGQILNGNVVNVQFADTGNFGIIHVVKNIHGCTDTTYHRFAVNPDLSYFIPNSFTPNDDGLNDTFFPKAQYLNEINGTLYIYDRWGNLVFSSNNPDLPWTGEINGSLAQPGVYLWKFMYTNDKAEKIEDYGQISLFR